VTSSMPARPRFDADAPSDHPSRSCGLVGDAPCPSPGFAQLPRRPLPSCPHPTRGQGSLWVSARGPAPPVARVPRLPPRFPSSLGRPRPLTAVGVPAGHSPSNRRDSPGRRRRKDP
jgi:hypothetical protein